MHSSHEPIPLSEAFPDFDGFGASKGVHHGAHKQRRRKRRGKKNGGGGKGKSQLQRSTDYYNALVNVIQANSSSDSDSDSSSSDPYSRPNPVTGQFFPPHQPMQQPIQSNQPPLVGPISREQCLEDQRLRHAGFVPNPNAPQLPRVPYAYSGDVQPGLAQRGPVDVMTVPPPDERYAQHPSQHYPAQNPSQPRAGAAFQNNPHNNPHNPDPRGPPAGHTVTPEGAEYNASAADASRFPPLSTSVPYAALSESQNQRLAVANSGYTAQDAAFGSRRQNFISGGAVGGGKSSSAAELAFGNLSLTTPDGVIDPYEHGGGTGLPPPPPRNKAAPPMDADSSLFDFSQDNLYPYTGYTDYAATYKNPYTGEVQQTYTLDLERYKTDVWKEVPTYELGKPHRKFTDWSGMGRLQRPLPKPGAEPNQYVMPTFDPTYGYADAQAARADARERALRENFFTRDPGLAGMLDQGNWTGYVGLRDMGRYYNANQFSRKEAPFAGPTTPYEIPQSTFEQAPYKVGMTAPGFYVSGRPDSFVDEYQAAEADVGNVVRPPQALARDPNAMADIPLPGFAPEAPAGFTAPYQPGATAGTGMHNSAVAGSMGYAQPGVDAGRVSQDAMAQQGAVNVPMSVFGVAGLANPGVDAGRAPQAASPAPHFGQAAFATNAPGGPQGVADVPGYPGAANPAGHYVGSLVTNNPGFANPGPAFAAPGGMPAGGTGVVPSVPLPSFSQIIDSGATVPGAPPQGWARPSMGDVVQNAFANPAPQVGGDGFPGPGPQGIADANKGMAGLVANAFANPAPQVGDGGGGGVYGGPGPQGIADANKGMSGLVSNAFGNPSAQVGDGGGGVYGGPGPQGIADAHKGMSGLVANAYGNPDGQFGGAQGGPGPQGIADAHKGMSGLVANAYGNPDGQFGGAGTQPTPSDAPMGSVGVPNRGPNFSATGGYDAAGPRVAAPVHPGDYAQPTANVIQPMSGPDVLALELTAPDWGKMTTELKDGSHYRNATMNAEAFLQANWATDSSRARANEMAAPRNQGITMTNPVTEAAPAMQLKAAQGMLPPGPSQASLHASNIAASQAFGAATPMPMYASDTDYATDC